MTRLFWMPPPKLSWSVKKKIQPIELVDAAIDRIEKINPQINAVITDLFDEARATARENRCTGAFAGVPFLLKDILASCKGARMTFGTGNLAGFVADHDSELVARYKRAGLIILGKTSTPELGLMPTTESRLFGPCRNPWNLDYTTGGSSGGSAAAVASGMVPVAHGNDGGGSIRIPASCCGVFGLKPTRGRNPLGPDFGDLLNGLVAEHVLSRSVRDSAAMLDATCGYDPGDPYTAPPPPGPYSREVGTNPGHLRIAMMADPPNGAPLDAECRQALHDSALLCSRLGHEVVEDAPPLNAELLEGAFTVLWSAGCASTIEGIAAIARRKPSAEQYEPVTWALYEIGKNVTASEYLRAVGILQKITRQVARFFMDYDLLMTSTLAEPPVKLGTFDSPPENPLKGWNRAGLFVPFTPLCNATGQPAMSVPLSWSSDGLPLGTHFMGRFGDETTLFRLAGQLEEARPWRNRKPPVSA